MRQPIKTDYGEFVRQQISLTNGALFLIASTVMEQLNNYVISRPDR
ncbi:hypothetical protein AC26_2063 [Escherichia coli 1-176-05_S3_C2]|nr:hypothetical protein AC26_2063 [Escherichia coli 1-176-05_S3_C2]